MSGAAANPVPSGARVTMAHVRIARASWASGSFLLYFGALLALFAAVSWLSVISSDHGQGALAGWSVLFWAVAEFLALWFLMQGRRVAAGVFAFVGLGLFAAMVAAFFSWWGWLSHKSGPFDGFHVGDLALELIVLLAALIDLRIWRYPLLVLPVVGLTWFFVTDFISSGGNWTNVVTLLFGFLFFLVGLGFDGSDSRPYGFWIHFAAGSLILGVFLSWWHTSDAQWAGIIIVSLVFIVIGAGIRRSSYAVLGVLGLVLATGHYAIPEMFPYFGSSSARATSWAGPVAYLLLGLFLASFGIMLYGRRDEDVSDSAL
jgi:hypothetical protein